MLLVVLGKRANLLAQEDLLHDLTGLGQESEPPFPRDWAIRADSLT
jgi:hypothetical protein